MYNNAPERFLDINNLQSPEVKFSDTIKSCEDVLLVESKGLAIVACDPGREVWNTVMVSLVIQFMHNMLLNLNMDLI